jgi:hypothetical protein
MEDNHYKVDTVSIRENQENRVSEMIMVIESKPILTPSVFVKSITEYKKIRDRKTEMDIQVLLWSMMVKIAALSGLKDIITDFDKTDIVRMLFTSFNDLSVEEIHKAFELERYGEYSIIFLATKETIRNKTEHFQLFNADYVGEILRKYKEWKRIIRTQHNISPELPKLPEMSESKIKETLNQGIIRRFEYYKETKEIEEPFVHIFEELLERSIIKKITGEKSFKYYQDKVIEAEIQIKKELAAEPRNNFLDKNKILEELSKIAESQSEKVQIRAKRIVLSEFFDKHISLNTDMENLINK